MSYLSSFSLETFACFSCIWRIFAFSWVSSISNCWFGSFLVLSCCTVVSWFCILKEFKYEAFYHWLLHRDLLGDELLFQHYILSQVADHVTHICSFVPHWFMILLFLASQRLFNSFHFWFNFHKSGPLRLQQLLLSCGFVEGILNQKFNWNFKRTV